MTNEKIICLIEITDQKIIKILSDLSLEMMKWENDFTLEYYFTYKDFDKLPVGITMHYKGSIQDAIDSNSLNTSRYFINLTNYSMELDPNTINKKFLLQWSYSTAKKYDYTIEFLDSKDLITILKKSVNQNENTVIKTPKLIEITEQNIDTDKIFYIEPKKIKTAMVSEFSIFTHSGKILNGDWDLDVVSFEQKVDFYDSFKEHLKGKPWEETNYFNRILNEIQEGHEKWGCKSKKELLIRCNKLDNLYYSIKQNGFIQSNEKDYIAINIGRNGEMIFNNGRHRLTFAKLLEIDRIPVKITVRHSEWINFKNEIIRYANKKNNKVYAPLMHIDLKEIPSVHHGRFEKIEHKIYQDSKTVLDIGTHWGYMCSMIESKLGKECYAIEKLKTTFYFLSKLKIAYNQKYHTIREDIFDFVEKQNKFDTVLALAIFHHFIKTPELHDKFKRLLNNLEMKQMIFQAHNTDEPQMKTAFRNYKDEEFVKFIIENSCLDSYEEIADFNGRKVYNIYKKVNQSNSIADFKEENNFQEKVKNNAEKVLKKSNKNNILFLGFVNESYSHILYKIYYQYKAVKKIHNNTDLLLIGKGNKSNELRNYPFQYIDVNENNNKLKFLQTMKISVEIAEKHISANLPDVIYMRYPLANIHTTNFVKKHNNVFIEYQTLVEDEFKVTNQFLYNQELNFGNEFLSNIKGFTAVTNEIKTHIDQKINKNIPSEIIPNGINTSDYPTSEMEYAGTINILFIPMYSQIWQGFYRVIEGLSRYTGSDNLLIHVVGNITDEYTLKIKELKLDKYFKLYGLQDHKNITKIADKCHVGIGAMAIHKKNLIEACALKLREYCSRGIPFVYAGNDPDFTPKLDFVHQFPLDDSPLDFNIIINLAKRAILDKNFKHQIRKFAEKNLDWNNKAKKILQLLVPEAKENLHERILSLASDLKKNKGNAEITSKLKNLLLKPSSRKPENQTKKVSIVIPYFNQGDTVVETLESIANQSYKNFEIVFVNDGSDHEIEHKLQNFSESYPDIEINYFYKENEGLAATRNFGISKAQSSYILPLDSDDLLASDFLLDTVNYLNNNPEISFVYTETLFFGAKNEIWSFRDFDPEYLLSRNMMTCTTLFKKEIWEKVGGYNIEMTYGYEDWNFWISAVEHGYKGGNIHYPYFLYRRKLDSMLEKRSTYDSIAKKQIIQFHPGIYNNDHPIEKELLASKIGLIPKELRLNANNYLAPKSIENENKSFRVLFVCHNFPPESYGGAQLYALKLAKEINKLNGISVSIIYPVFREEYKGTYIEEAEFQSVKVYKLHKKFDHHGDVMFRNPVVGEKFEEFLVKEKFDLIHFHSFGQMTAIVIEIAKKMDIPTVMIHHEHWFLCYLWFLTHKDQTRCSGPESYEKCAKCYLKQVGHIPPEHKNLEFATKYFERRGEYLHKCFDSVDIKFSPSKFVADYLDRFGFSGVNVKPLGMNPISRVEHRKSTKLRFGFIGQILERKGVNILLSAFIGLNKENTELFVYGSSYKKKMVENYKAACKKYDNIHIMGKYIPEDLPQILANIDILVVPSLWENYPLVVQEAFQNKVPVIASNIGGFPEIIRDGENGLLFEVGNPQDLFLKMKYIYDNQNLLEIFRSNIKPVKEISEDALDYKILYEKLANTKGQVLKSNNYIVQFYIQKSVHWPIYENLYNYLRKQSEVGEIVFCIPRLFEIVNSGSYNEIEEVLYKADRIVKHPKDANADITFIASTVQGKVRDCGKVVSIGHGTISKGFFFSDNVWVHRENWVDLLCVPGNFAKVAYEKILKTNVVATGMPKLDTVFDKTYDKDFLCKKYNLDKNKKIVLYAPTFNIDLSSVYDFANRFHELDNLNYYILIKLHGSTIGSLFNHYRELSSRTRNIIFIEESNLAYLLGGADLMISDVSSAFMEFMALDKPVILYDNPNRLNYHGYHETDIEWAWRDLGTQINSFDELKNILPKILMSGDGKTHIRKKYSELLFADLQGNASKNVWTQIKRLLPEKTRPEVELLSFVIVVTDENWIFTRSQISASDVIFRVPMEIVVVLNNVSNKTKENFQYMIDYHEYINFTVIQTNTKTWLEALKVGFEKTNGNIVFTMKEHIQLFSNYDFVLEKTFRENPSVNYLTGLSTDPNKENYYSKFAQKESSDITNNNFSYLLYNKFKGSETTMIDNSYLPSFFAFRKNKISLEEILKCRQFNIALSMLYHEVNEKDIATIMDYWRLKNEIPENEFVKSLSEILNTYYVADLAEYMVDYYSYNNGDQQKLVQYINISLSWRFYDIAYKEKLINKFPDSLFAENFRKDLRLIRKVGKVDRKIINTDSVKSRKILFYFFKNVHIPILLPIYTKLKELHPDFEIGFGYLEPAPQIRAGLESHEVDLIASYGEKLFLNPQQFHPDITFIADSVYPWVQNCGKLVNVGHGILSKGQYYTDTELARREEQADLVCVPGKYHENIMKKLISTPVVATGMAKLDLIFSNQRSKDDILKDLGLPVHMKFILFAPTFNDELSTIPFIKDNLPEILPDDETGIIIKLHSSTKPEYKQMYKNLALSNSNIFYTENLDIAPYLLIADVMITDVSSAMMEFAALNKPLVLYNNPNWEKYQNYNPNDIEFIWRDIGIEVNNLFEMKRAVKICLLKPEIKEDKRKYYSDQLLENKYDGKAAEKIINETLKRFC